MFNHPYATILKQIDHPGRYIGGEFGSRSRFDQTEAKIALAFPDAYEIGMSHMGLAILYEMLNKQANICAERVYMPWGDMEALLRKHNLPLVSLESAKTLCEFDAIGFSLQYELTFTNLLTMLDLGRVPRRSKDREQSHPLVIVGGPVAVESEPISPFVDLVVIGDGEESLLEIMEIIKNRKKQGDTREELLKELNKLPYAYVPAFLKRITDEKSGRQVADVPAGSAAKTAVVSNLGVQPTGMGPSPNIKAVFDRFSVEIARGCTQGCRFCQAGFLYRPIRERTEQQIEDSVHKAVACMGFDEVSLSALSSADHSRITEIITKLGDQFTQQRVSLSVPSLRAYGLSTALVEVLARLRSTGVTLAPEAGSQRLRDVVNKNVTEADLMAAAARFFDHGITKIKLYFMIGLPTETDADLEEIIGLAYRLRAMARRKVSSRRLDIGVSVSTFVPKPLTPFEREEMINIDEIRRRQRILIGLGKDVRLTVKVHDPRLTWLEGIFARGDARLADALEYAVDNGARFCGWGELFKNDVWQEALKDIDTDSLLYKIDDDATLPWSHIHAGVSKKFLLAERDLAKKQKTTLPCGRFEREPDQAPTFICHACGVKCKAADLPVQPKRETLSKSDKTDITPVRRGRPKPTLLNDIENLQPKKFRITVSVFGRQTFLGHLDRMRHITRSLRRAGLTVLYTQGFHPKPKIEAAPPLPLGTAGLNEPVDLWLVNPPSETEILTRLKATVPPDMKVTSAKPLGETDKKLSKTYDAAHYLTFLACTPEAASQALKELLAKETLVISRTRKGKTKALDIRPYLLEAGIAKELPADLPVPKVHGRTPIAMTIAVPGSGGTKPAELLSPWFKEAVEDAWIIRTHWIKKPE